MRIAILSLLLNTNYGGILQSYALQTVLERMGHKVRVLDHEFISDLPIRQLLKIYPRRFFGKYILKKNISIYTPQHYKWLRYREKSANTRSFIFQHIKIRKCRALRRLRHNEFDAIVVGSDQVWRPSYFSCWGSIKDAFLLFAKGWNIRRISYAASFGINKWTLNPSDTKTVRELIKLFDAVSVRELDGVDLCKDNLDKEAIQVLDPTLLLSRSDYEELIDSSEVKTTIPESSLLNYILDDNEQKNSMVECIAKEKSLKVFRINKSEDIKSNDKRQPVEVWLKAFRDSDFIVTDSYHACLFSIIFEKPFVCIVNKQRGLSRFQTLATLFGLSRHFITSANDYDASYDYSISPSVYNELEKHKTISIDFLRRNLPNE